MEDHLAKFHKMTNAKEMWEAFKSRFGGNDESKKMQKYILKQQFEGFSVLNSEELHKGYDRLTASSSSTQNGGIVTENTSSTMKLDRLWYLEQLDEFDLEEMDLKWKVAMISMRMKKFYKKTDPRGIKIVGGEMLGTLGIRIKKMGGKLGKQEDSKTLVTLDGEGVDWTSHSEDEQ
ncbi:hypothetical protein Tco_0227301 [Tanacetum coccineum]